MKLTKIINGRINVSEPLFYDVTASEAVVTGEALVLSSGKLTKCGATTKPAFIALADKAAADSNRELAVIPVENAQLYEVTATASIASLNVGDKVTLSSTATGITATTTSGVAEIVEKLSATSAIVRF